MTPGRDPGTSGRPGVARLLAAAAGGGLLGGAAVALLAFLVARYGPAGGGWSFRGNGALAVYPLVLPVLTAGWTGLVLRRRAHPRWPLLAVASGLLGALLVVISATALPMFGSGPLTAPVTLLGLVAALAWTAAAPLWARSTPSEMTTGGPGAAAQVAAGAAWALAIFAGLVAAGLLVPAGS